MQRQSIIVVIDKLLNRDFLSAECFGNLKKACKAHGWTYNTMVQKKLPQEKDGYLIQRVPFI